MADVHVRPDRTVKLVCKNYGSQSSVLTRKHTVGASNNISRQRSNKVIKIEKIMRVQIGPDQFKLALRMRSRALYAERTNRFPDVVRRRLAGGAGAPSAEEAEDNFRRRVRRPSIVSERLRSRIKLGCREDFEGVS